MKKLTILFLFIFTFSVPVFSTFAYTTGLGLVPDCNKGELKEFEVKDANGEVIRDANGVAITEWRLGETKCGFNELIMNSNSLANNAIDFLLFYIATPIAALIFCYAGFKLLTSGGSEEAKTGVKKMLLTMVKGYIIALIAWLVIHTLVTSLGFVGDTFLSK